MALKSVLLDELRDMYSAENQLVKAVQELPKLQRQNQYEWSKPAAAQSRSVSKSTRTIR